MSLVREGYVDFLCSSLSQPQEFPHIMKRIEETKRKVYQFPLQLQCPTLTTSCGCWCLYIFYLISRNFSPKEILHYFFDPSSSSSFLFRPHLDTSLNRDLLLVEVIRYLFPTLQRFSSDDLLLDTDFLRQQKQR